MDDFLDSVRGLIVEHETDRYVKRALREMKIRYVNDVPAQRRSWLIIRASALWQERTRDGRQARDACA